MYHSGLNLARGDRILLVQLTQKDGLEDQQKIDAVRDAYLIDDSVHHIVDVIVHDLHGIDRDTRIRVDLL